MVRHFQNVMKITTLLNGRAKPHATTVISIRSSRYKILILSIILLVILLYIVDISQVRLPAQFRLYLPLISCGASEEKWSWEFIREQDESEYFAHQSYFVNTIGCRMPSFEVINPNVQKYMRNVKPIVCQKPLTRSNNNFLWIDLNETELQHQYRISDVSKLLCWYEPFFRKDDFTNEFRTNYAKYHFHYGDIVKISDEFIKVTCSKNHRIEIYHDYHYFIQTKRDQAEFSFKKESRWSENDDKVYKEDDNLKRDDNPNVMIIGLDSVSRLNFHRHMNDSVQFLLKELNAIELYGYNKVADNTYPNLIPALTGLDENELISACIPHKNETFDLCNFIWDDFKQKNYSTAFGEDIAALGLFHYLRRGFTKQSTDYNIRPMLIEMEKNIGSKRDANAFMCLGGRRTYDVILEYARKFVTFMTSGIRKPFFSFFWTSSYTHDYLTYPSLIDNDFMVFLKNLSALRALDNTFLLVMSDHGIRWGSFRSTYQGMMEERQPFLFVVPPKWFPEKYPEAMRNLVRNRHKLTTHFDLYETLRDLLDLPSLTMAILADRSKELLEIDSLPRGISLFLPIPPSRTCYSASISAHWCTCHEKTELSTTDPRVLRVAHMMVKTINDLVKMHRECQRLHLNSISVAIVGSSNTAIRNRNVSNHFVDITVRLDTKPGFGEFEATVRVHEKDEPELTGTISRTNLYGKQSECIDDYKLKLYCFCDSFL